MGEHKLDLDSDRREIKRIRDGPSESVTGSAGHWHSGGRAAISESNCALRLTARYLVTADVVSRLTTLPAYRAPTRPLTWLSLLGRPAGRLTKPSSSNMCSLLCGGGRSGAPGHASSISMHAVGQATRPVRVPPYFHCHSIARSSARSTMTLTRARFLASIGRGHLSTRLAVSLYPLATAPASR